MINPLLFLFTELSSASILRYALVSDRELGNAVYYRDERGYLIPLIAGSFHNVAGDEDFIIGLFMHDKIYSIYDIQRRQIVIDNDMDSVLMDAALHERYDQCFVRLTPPTRPRSPPHSPRHSLRRFPPNS